MHLKFQESKMNKTVLSTIIFMALINLSNLGKANESNPINTVEPEKTQTNSHQINNTNTNSTTDHLTHTNIPVIAWIGNKDTLLNFPDSATGMEFYYSSEKNCFVESPCSKSRMDILKGNTIVDNYTSLSRAGYYALKHNEKYAKIAMNNNVRFSERKHHAAIVYKNKLWVVGGSDDGHYKNDVWSSQNGIEWTQEVEHVPFSPRHNVELIDYNNKLWLFGGYDFDGPSKEVWLSDDGITWTQQFVNLPCEEGSAHHIFVHKNQLWLIGTSKNTDSGRHSMWSSDDGINWSLTAGTIPEAPYKITKVISHDENIWLFSEGNEGSPKSKIWISSDEKNWEQKLPDKSSPNRYEHDVIFLMGRFGLLGAKMHT